MKCKKNTYMLLLFVLIVHKDAVSVSLYEEQV